MRHAWILVALVAGPTSLTAACGHRAGLPVWPETTGTQWKESTGQMLAHERVKDKRRISPFHLSQHRRGMRPLKEAPKEEAVVTPDDR